MECTHNQLAPRNLAELLPVYVCNNCGKNLICACEASWFERHDPSRYRARLKEAEVAEKVCGSCRGMPDTVAAYGRSAFSRRHWREIYKRKSELLEKNADLLDGLRSKSEEAEKELRSILWHDFEMNRWGSFLRRAPLAGTPLHEISDDNFRRAVAESNWRTARNCLLKEFEKGESVLKGEALAVLARLHENYDRSYRLVDEIDKQAENIVREANGVPLIGQGWVSETELYNLVKDLVSPLDVVQHARSPWLGKQHLDIFIPQLDLAIEYMGEQHFRATEFFGGEDAFQKRKELDKRKGSLCRENGVKLVYVTADDEMSIASIEKILDRSRAKGRKSARSTAKPLERTPKRRRRSTPVR